jgi:alkyl hydroperoxide reductase subunit AhpC
MVTVGFAAPPFDCLAVVEGNFIRLSWQQLHENKPLVLLFGALDRTGQSASALVALAGAATRLREADAKLAVVCREHESEMRVWSSRLCARDGHGLVTFPLIVDAEDRVSGPYGMLLADGGTLCGEVLIDASGIVRHVAASSFRVKTDVAELVRCIETLALPGGPWRWN